MGLIRVFLYCSFLERTVHTFYLAIGPGVGGFGQSMIDTLLLTDTIKDMMKGIDIALAIGELATVSGSYRVDVVRHDGHQAP